MAIKSGIIPLLNSIVDVCLVYGIDETSKVLELESSLEWKEGTALQADVKIHFLQLIAPGVAYPERTSTPNNDLPQSNAPVASHSKHFKVENLGLTWETIETLHWFIYPEGARNSQEEVQATTIPMLLTNIEGAHSYVTGIRFSRPFFIQKPVNTRICKLFPWKKTIKEPPPPDSKLLYVPTCIVLVSKHPYFQFMKDALSGLFRVMMEEDDTLDFWECLRSFMNKLFLVPSPPSDGQLLIQVQLPGFLSPLVIRPPKGGLYLDITLHYPFLSLSVDNVLKVFTALILEQRTIFLSSKYPLLTYTIQNFLYYLSPFDWRSPCVPILPYQVQEYLEAPGVYIMGCHTSFKDSLEFKALADVVVVNLDTDQVIYQQMEALPSLPKTAADTFRKCYRLLSRTHFTMEEAYRLSPASAGEIQKEREAFEYRRDTELSKIFLELMVNIFDFYSKQFKHSRAQFEEVISKTDAEDQEFYRMACNTDMFSGFCHSRHRGTERGEFEVLAAKVERGRKKGIMMSIFESSITTHQLKHSISAPNEFLTSVSLAVPASMATESLNTSASAQVLSSLLEYSAQSEQFTLELPSLLGDVDRMHFIDSTISILNELCLNKKNLKLSAPCTCILGFYKIAQGNIMEGCDDLFDTLKRLDIHLVPNTSVMKPYIASLEQDFKARTYYTDLFSKCNRSMLERHPVEGQAIKLTDKLPTGLLGLSDFLKIVKQNDLVADNDTATCLYFILTDGRSTNISPDVFASFYDTWKAVTEEIKRVTELINQIEKTEKNSREVVLAVSDNVKSSCISQGQLVITTYRVLIITQYKVYPLGDLCKQIRFDQGDVRLGLLSGTRLPAITVEQEGPVEIDVTAKRRRHISNYSNDAYVAFQTPLEQEAWLKMITEMKRGLELSKARRDPQLIVLAQTHVTMCNVILQSGILEKCSCTTQRTKHLLKLLTLHSKNTKEVTDISTGITVDSLQYRINPCLQESETQSVESILYIPSAEPGVSLGKLWIGLGNGRLKVYDMEHKCFESDIRITESRCGKSVRLSCLLLVNRHVWVGSLTKDIHIMDAETVCHVSQLSFLENPPRGMVLSKSEPQLVWVLLLNGVLLAFHPETRARMAKLQVPNMSARLTCTCFTILDDFLWVGNNQGTIAILNTQNSAEVSSINLATDNTRCQVEIKDIAVSKQKQIWCSVHTVPRTDQSDYVAVIDHTSHKIQYRNHTLTGRVSAIVPVQSTMWCGTKTGKLYIFDSNVENYMKEKAKPKCLAAHDDFIRTIAVCDEGCLSEGHLEDGAGLEAISEDGAGLEAISEDGAGLEAISEDGAGLEAISEDGAGLEAISEDGAGLEAISEDGAGLGISTQGSSYREHYHYSMSDQCQITLQLSAIY
ncbi:hypothetical protein EMCRGX_G021370 [Ephydatia muelleri]